jgi:hypothetical protein
MIPTSLASLIVDDEEGGEDVVGEVPRILSPRS